MKDKIIKAKVDAALSSINNIKAAVPSPYFYTKVLAKLNRQKATVWDNLSTFFLRPTIAFATICFIVVINAFVVYSKMDINFSLADQNELALSDEYNQAVTSLYDLENEKP